MMPWQVWTGRWGKSGWRLSARIAAPSFSISSLTKANISNGGDFFRRLQVGAIPHRAAVGRVKLDARALADQDAVVELLEVAVNGEREGAVAAGFLLDDQHRHHVPVPLQPGLGHHLRQHFERGDDADRRAFVVARPASEHRAAFDARGEVGSYDVKVGVERHGLPGVATGGARDHVKQVGAAGIGSSGERPCGRWGVLVKCRRE